MINHRLLAHNSREEAIAMKRILFLLLLTAFAALVLTGCASSADTLPTPTPGATNMLDNLMPENSAGAGPAQGAAATASPEGTAGPAANGERTLEDVQKNSQAMEEAVEKLSEVDEAYVVTVGDTALVGLKFAGQYQGQTDDRLKKMVLARVQTVDKTIAKAAVTDNGALVTGIQALAEALKGASSLNDVNDKAEEILRQLTVYGG